MPAARSLPPEDLHLGSIVDESLLADAIDRALVSVRAEGPLRILNYTPRATYDRAWNQATLTCRGLIVDADDRVVARPFPKFFGPAEPDAPPVPGGRPMVVTEKLDGSLGIAYHHPDGGIRLATRGSLSSDQAVEATSIWHEKYAHVRFERGLTPLFEIVYPANRVVTDYGDMRDLVLLAVIDVPTGADLPPDVIDWPGPHAPRHDFGSFADLVDHVSSSQESAREGYVVRFDTGPDHPHIRLKLKFPAYVVTHRMLTGLTAARVWEIVAVGRRRVPRPQSPGGIDPVAPRPRSGRHAVRSRPRRGSQRAGRPPRGVLAVVRRLRGRVPHRGRPPDRPVRVTGRPGPAGVRPRRRPQLRRGH